MTIAALGRGDRRRAARSAGRWPLLAVAMSAGLGVGAVVGWILVRRSAAIALGGPLGRPMLTGLLAAAVAAGAVLWPARQLADVGLVAATAGAIGLAAALHDDLRRGAAAGPAAAGCRALGAPSAAGRAGESS